MHVHCTYILFSPSHSKCSSVAARYELKEVFDNLIITLCKFTSLLNTHEVCRSQGFFRGGGGGGGERGGGGQGMLLPPLDSVVFSYASLGLSKH